MKQTLSVSELNSLIKNIIEPNFISVSVSGEISNFSVSAAGHCYFTLKDEFSELQAVLFRGNNRNSYQNILKNGQKIIVTGEISVYQEKGRYQIICRSVSSDGLGSLMIKFEELKNKLKNRGWFDSDRKKEIPEFPAVIGIISSEFGAAYQDILNVIKRRFPVIKILFYPVTVQGKTAKNEICKAFEFFRDNPEPDVIILARGGGSIEDLWPFNEEIVVESVYNCSIPVITGIGHETDFTISDFVADLRAPTPTAAAELAVPDITELRSSLSMAKKRISNMLISKLDFYKQKIEFFRNSRFFRNPAEITEKQRLRLDEISNSMITLLAEKKNRYKTEIIIHRNNFLKTIQTKIEIKKKQFGYLLSTFKNLNPLNIIERGYSVVSDDSEKVLVSINQIKPEQNVKVSMKDGYFRCTVNSCFKK